MMHGSGGLAMGKEGKGAAKVKIGKTVQYGAIAIQVLDAMKCAEFSGAKCPEGSLFAVIGVKLENTKSAGTAFIVPDEEMWLSIGEGEPLKAENYKFETALDPKKPSEGHVWFIVPACSEKLSLMFGKKKMPKTPVDFGF